MQKMPRIYSILLINTVTLTKSTTSFNYNSKSVFIDVDRMMSCIYTGTPLFKVVPFSTDKS